ncbi:DegT/DnrJ/EryC1/StrS aminotransferase family protein (plasmid) [Sphingobium yanoikuyae]|uniref:DegT/DnrJ/EryC1/StrS aminotransferase family protein n=1 Tax=Sphingobium yanoikuyae TaxID=13690 RepID=A0A6M4GGH4_SPHYA|nr:DegT/DnrJ/EryC1/StrS aminotransferase family protein [Sphingobium yanoikuyae]QJR06235.1 DegT/DnrJ/EryC1/StrS aminotransferase family protein [Sphingobium yanoikuyae]
MLNTNFAPWPSYTQEEADAVSTVLLSNRVNYWTGEECRAFEREFAAWSDSGYAIAVANGTVALDLALQGLGIGSANGGSAEDEVIVTPRTFIASISCVANAGARPVFADVERASGNISAETCQAVLTPHTRAIIAVHLAGWPCDMDPIMNLAAAHGIKVIEDCAQAHGACYKGRSVGSIGHVSAWSFCQDKIMTTGGEGGMVTCNDRDLWSRMWSFKDHGKSWEAVYERAHPPGFRWLHESIGTNWRMLEMQAAIGRIQLRRMNEWTCTRTANAAILHEALTPFADKNGIIRLHGPFGPDRSWPEGSVHAFYKYYAYVRPENLASGWSRDRIVTEMGERGIPCFQGSCSEVYLEKAFDGTGWRPEVPLPVARELGGTSLMFLVHPTLSSDDMARVSQAIGDMFKDAMRTQETPS